MLKPFEAKIKTTALKNRMSLLAFSLIFFPFKDLLIFLSGSGNSENIINALKVSNEIGLNNYAVLGFDGGKCKDIAKNTIHVPVSDMLVSEDIQMIIFNICFQWIVKKMNSI